MTKDQGLPHSWIQLRFASQKIVFTKDSNAWKSLNLNGQMALMPIIMELKEFLQSDLMSNFLVSFEFIGFYLIDFTMIDILLLLIILLCILTALKKL